MFNFFKKKESSPRGPGEGAQYINLKQTLPGLSQVKHVIAVASGKGGVGKSTIAAALSASLKEKGYRVGLLDADIYGPSQCQIFGVPLDQRPNGHNGQILPLEAHGVKFMSMGVLLGNDSPVIWRAPMATRAVGQFLNVAWGELDFLVLDLPPGTGDIQITLSQQANLSGVIVVSTPQLVALGVAQKGLEMFKQVSAPILGIVENMSGLNCSHCGQTNHIFKGGGAKEMAENLKIPFLGGIPLDPTVMESADNGNPLALASNPAFANITSNFLESLANIEQRHSEAAPEQVAITREGQLYLYFKSGLEGLISAYELRLACPCASCVDENTGKRTLDPKTVPLDIALAQAKPVGRYGLSLDYSQKHATGIMRFDRLVKLLKGETQEQESFEV